MYPNYGTDERNDRLFIWSNQCIAIFILGPLSTLVFMTSSIIAKIKGRKCKIVSIILDIIGVLIILSVLIPIAMAICALLMECN